MLCELDGYCNVCIMESLNKNLYCYKTNIMSNLL